MIVLYCTNLHLTMVWSQEHRSLFAANPHPPDWMELVRCTCCFPCRAVIQSNHHFIYMINAKLRWWHFPLTVCSLSAPIVSAEPVDFPTNPSAVSSPLINSMLTTPVCPPDKNWRRIRFWMSARHCSQSGWKWSHSEETALSQTSPSQ